MRGYIKESRKVEDYGWKDHASIVIRNYLIHRASIEDTVFMGLPLKRGQVATSYKSIEDATGYSRQSVRSAMNRLVSQQAINMLDIRQAARNLTPKPTCQGLLVSIVNYDCADVEPEEANRPSNRPSNSDATSQAAASQHQYNINEELTMKFVPPTEDDIISFCQSEGINGFDVRSYYKKYSAIGWKDKNGNSIVDWRAHVGYCAGYIPSSKKKTDELSELSDLEDILSEAREARKKGVKK